MALHDHGKMEIRGHCPVCKSLFEMNWNFSEEAPRDFIFKRVCDQALDHVKEHLVRDHGVRMEAQLSDRQIRVPVFQQAWSTWTDCSSTEPVAFTTTSSEAWTVWGVDHGTSSSTTVWVTWVDNTPHYHGVDHDREYLDVTRMGEYNEYVLGNWNIPPETTARREAREQRARIVSAEQDRQRQYWEQQETETRRRNEDRKVKEAAIEATARELLREVLTDEQNNDLDKNGHFEINVVGGARYRIKKGSAYNVEKLDTQGKVIEKLCFAPPGLPVHDIMVTQKLMLETDEEGTRRLANINRQ